MYYIHRYVLIISYNAQCAQNAKIRKKLIIPMYLNHIASLRCHWNRLFMRNLNLGCPVLFCAIMAYFVLFLPYFGNFRAKLNIFGVKKYVLEPGNSVVIFSCNFHKLFCTFFAILCYYWLFCAIFTIFWQFLGHF